MPSSHMAESQNNNNNDNSNIKSHLYWSQNGILYICAACILQLIYILESFESKIQFIINYILMLKCSNRTTLLCTL